MAQDGQVQVSAMLHFQISLTTLCRDVLQLSSLPLQFLIKQIHQFFPYQNVNMEYTSFHLQTL